MTAFMSFIFSFFTDFIAMLVKKLGVKAVLIGLQKTIQALFLASFVAGIYYIFDFINYAYGLISNFATGFNSLGGGQISSLFFGILDASGIGSAVVSVLNLYIGIYFFLIARYLFSVFMRLSSVIYMFASDNIKLLAS